jgi:putative colanic acid biosynthesis glycosyltransferase
MLFSVITVTLENLSGLKRTAASLAAQNCRDYEWIVVDGGSKDGTRAYLEQSRAIWASEKDNGIYDAMNKGMGEARGAYLLFLNAGDTLAGPDVLARLAARLEKDAPDLVYGDALEGAPGEKPELKKARPHRRIARGMFTHHQAMLYRRGAVGALRYDTSLEIAADYKFTAQILLRRGSALYVPEPLCVFEPGGVSQQQAETGRREQFRARRDLGLAGPVRNRLIYAGQSFLWLLRKKYPALYWAVRSRIA